MPKILVVGLELTFTPEKEYSDRFKDPSRTAYVSVASEGIVKNMTTSPVTDFNKRFVTADIAGAQNPNSLQVGELPYTRIKLEGWSKSDALFKDWKTALGRLDGNDRIVLAVDVTEKLEWQKNILELCRTNIDQYLTKGEDGPKFVGAVINSDAKGEQRKVSPEEVQALMKKLEIQQADVVQCPKDKTGKVNVQPLLAHMGVALQVAEKKEAPEKKAAPGLSIWSAIQARISGKSTSQKADQGPSKEPAKHGRSGPQ